MTPQQLYIKQLEKSLATQAKTGGTMKGFIRYLHDRGRWAIVWPDTELKKKRYIHRHRGEFMPCTSFLTKRGMPILDERGRLQPDKAKCEWYARAEKMLTDIRNRYDQAERGECVFDIDDFINGKNTDIIEFYKEWIKEGIEETERKPGTIKGYKSYLKNWVIPFFKDKELYLHQVDLQTTMSFMKFIKKGLRKKEEDQKNGIIDPKSKTGIIMAAITEIPEAGGREIARHVKKTRGIQVSPGYCRKVMRTVKNPSKKKQTEEKKNIGKTVLNIVSSFSTMMDYAKRCGKITEMPPFPKKEDYGLKSREIKWLSEEDAEKVYAAIPDEDRPIFDWLKYHFRRPGEAVVLQKVDYDPVNQSFTVQRALSGREEVDSVKTNWKDPTVHKIPCHPAFIETAERIYRERPDSPYFFNNPRARKLKRYSLDTLNTAWSKACEKVGVEGIAPYQGTKHTACTQFLEDGGTIPELQIMTQHKNIDSVKPYGDITMRRIRMAQDQAIERKKAEEKRREVSKAGCQEGAKVVSLFDYKQ